MDTVTRRNIRDKISKILVSWSMPTRQAAIGEIIHLFELQQEAQVAERKREFNDIITEIKNADIGFGYGSASGAIVKSQIVKYLEKKRDKHSVKVIQEKKNLVDLLPKIENNLAEILAKDGLKYLKLTDYQHRIMSVTTKKYVDWWDGPRKTMRKIDGSYDDQGVNKKNLIKEIEKLT